jgi:two-component system response regulator FixJ
MSREVPVYIVDDDAAVCRSLALLLKGEGFFAKSYLSAAGLLRESIALPAGVIVADVRMPQIDGLALLDLLRGAGRYDPVVFISGHADVPIAVRAIKHGACDFIVKPFLAAEILSAVIDAASSLERSDGPPPSFSPVMPETLTKREREVLSALLEGATNKQIAQKLGLSPRTVEIHRAHVMKKTGARSFSQLVRMGLEIRRRSIDLGRKD